MTTHAQHMTTIRCPSYDVYHAALCVFAYWWAPPDTFHETPNGCVGMLPSPQLYTERLALSLRIGQ